MDKREQRQRRQNIVIVISGVVLALLLIVIPRGGMTSISWSNIEVFKWIAIAVILFVSLILQYYLLLLLRHGFFKYLALWVIPVIWLFNNGLVAMHRFFDWTTDIISPAGWFQITELISWMLGVIFFPVLMGFGMIAAIIDVSISQLTQACYYAGIAMDVANISPWNIIDFGMNFISIFWDLVSNSFVQEVLKERSAQQSFWDLRFTDAISLPQWIMNIGYSFTCLIF